MTIVVVLVWTGILLALVAVLVRRIKTRQFYDWRLPNQLRVRTADEAPKLFVAAILANVWAIAIAGYVIWLMVTSD